MKTIITALATAAASAFVYDVNAQSLEQGKKLIVYERYGSAVTMLQPLAGASPEANYHYGLALLGTGNVAAAMAAFDKNPSDYMNVAGKARALYTQGKGAEAFALLQGIVDNAKKKDWEKYKVAADAITYSKSATQIDEAIAWYRTADERKPKNSEILLGLGDALLRKNTGESNGEASKMFDAIIAEGSLKSLGHARKGLLMLNGRNVEEALVNYNLAKESDKENPLPYGDLAEAYYRSGKMELAKQNIVEYLKLSDKSTRDQLRYGNILYLTKDYTGAEKIYADLIATGEGKKTPSLYRGLAFAQYQNKDFSGALASFDAYRAAVPEKEYDYEDYLYYAAVNSMMAKDDATNADKYKAAAESSYTKALQAPSTKDKKEVYRLIADSYKESKEWGKVAEWYGKLVDANANEADATDYFNAGYYAYFAKDFKTAESRLNAFNAKFPEENLGYFWLGRVKAAQDADVKTGIAEESFKTWLARPVKEKEVRENKDLNYAYQYLMVLAYNKGQGKEAVEYGKKILEIMPQDKTAPQIIEHFNKKGIK